MNKQRTESQILVLKYIKLKEENLLEKLKNEIDGDKKLIIQEYLKLLWDIEAYKVEELPAEKAIELVEDLMQQFDLDINKYQSEKSEKDNEIDLDKVKDSIEKTVSRIKTDFKRKMGEFKPGDFTRKDIEKLKNDLNRYKDTAISNINDVKEKVLSEKFKQEIKDSFNKNKDKLLKELSKLEESMPKEEFTKIKNMISNWIEKNIPYAEDKDKSKEKEYDTDAKEDIELDEDINKSVTEFFTKPAKEDINKRLEEIKNRKPPKKLNEIELNEDEIINISFGDIDLNDILNINIRQTTLGSKLNLNTSYLEEPTQEDIDALFRKDLKKYYLSYNHETKKYTIKYTKEEEIIGTHYFLDIQSLIDTYERKGLKIKINQNK